MSALFVCDPTYKMAINPGSHKLFQILFMQNTLKFDNFSTYSLYCQTITCKTELYLYNDFNVGSFHAKSPKIRKISRVTISDFDENWLKCSSTYMMATCKKVLSSGNKFYFYSHIYTGGVFPIS